MLKKLLATTAMIGIFAGTAFAQDAATPATPATPNAMIFDRNAQALTDTDGYFAATAGQLLASGLMGENVYNSTAENAEKIGDVNDVVMGPNGAADAVIIGVGGFLGIGEKAVAVDFDRLTWVEKGGDRWLVVEATKAQLEAAPAFDTTMFKQAAAAATSEMQTASTAADGKYETVDRSALTAEALIGTRVYGAGDTDLGEIGDIVMGADNMVEAYIVDVGGFLGMGEKAVAIDAAKINVLKAADGTMVLRTSFSEEQLKAQKTYTADTYKTDRDLILMR
jgi:sporulation protein YlmC with PRC-barrel domain